MPLSKKLIKKGEDLNVKSFALEFFSPKEASREMEKILRKKEDVQTYSFLRFDNDLSVHKEEPSTPSLEEFDEPNEVQMVQQETSESISSDTVVDSKDHSPDQLEPFVVPNIKQLADEEIAKAREEADRIKQEAFEKGKKEGYEAGFQQGLGEASEITNKLKRTLSSIENLPPQILRDYKRWLIEAAFTVAKHIVQTELTQNRQLYLNMLEKLIKNLEEDTPITIFLNPEDMASLRLSTDLEEWANLQGLTIRFKEDPTLEPGSCRLENDVELLDASLDSCIKEMKRELYAEMGS